MANTSATAIGTLMATEYSCAHVARRDASDVKFAAESLGHSRRRRARARVHRLGLRVEHVQPSDLGALSRCAVVVQPAIYHLHLRAGAARSQRRVRWAVGGA